MSELKFRSTHPKASCPNILGKMLGKSCKNKSESKERTHTCKAVHMWLVRTRDRAAVIRTKTQTFMPQNVTSLWQSEVQMILIRSSYALGGSTTISSMASGSPAPLHTAAVRRRPAKKLLSHDGMHARKKGKR
jgi:hypothetical protein